MIGIAAALVLFFLLIFYSSEIYVWAMGKITTLVIWAVIFLAGFLIGRLSAGGAVRVRTGHPAKDVASSAAGTSSADAAEPSAATDAPAPQAPTADAPLNLNTAAKEELMLLPRIGETLAERILAYRAENGSFVSTEQLMDIDGIGEGTYNSIRDLVTVEDNP